MQKLIDFLARLGVVDGLTFRARIEDGVGVFIEPNPRPNRINPQAVPGTPERRAISGNWTARRVYLSDRFPFLQ